MNDLTVELSTPHGRVFTATASSIDAHTEDGSIHISSDEESYLNMINATEITLQTADGPCVFILENAVAGLKGRAFTVLAESIRRVEPVRASSGLFLNVGTVTRRELRERAVELAVTDGRSAQDASNADWEQAKREVSPDLAPETQQPKA